MGMFLIFVAAFVCWLILRTQVVLTEWQRRSMWITTVFLGGAFLLFGTTQLNDLAQNVVWPLCAGLMGSELFWQRYSPRLSFLKPGFAAEPAATQVKKKRRKKRPPTL